MDGKKVEMTDEKIIKALECCIEGDCTVHGSEKSCKICPLEGIGIGDGICTVVLRKKALELIHRLQTALDTNQCIIRLLEQDVADRDRQLESKVEAVYADFMKDYKIMRDELKECYAEFGKEQVETEKVIAEQKAEIERLTEEHERIAWSKQQYLDWVHGFLSTHTDMKDRGEKCKMFDRDWMCGVFWEKIEGSLEYIIELENQRNELQKQVDELKEENAQLSEMADYDKGHKEGYEHGAKTTAKDILQEMTNLVRNNEDFGRGVFGWQTSDILTLIKIYAKEKRGVEVE